MRFFSFRVYRQCYNFLLKFVFMNFGIETLRIWKLKGFNSNVVL